MMSPRFSLSPPAWEGFVTNKAPKLLEVTDSIALQIKKILNAENAKIYNLIFQNSISRHYILDFSESEKERFYIKLIKSEQYEQQNKINLINKLMSEKNVSVMSLSKNELIKLDNFSYINTYKYCNGRYPIAQINDLRYIASELANFHNNLTNSPYIDIIKKNTYDRYDFLLSARDNIITGKNPETPRYSKIKSYLSKQDISVTSYKYSMALHGDLNPGNILINEFAKKNKAIFLDLEDSLHSYLPVVYDLAYFLERILFITNYNQYDIIEKSIDFIKTYNDNGGVYAYEKKDELVLSILSLRSLCVLSMCEWENISIPDSEWNKFFYLLNKSEQLQNILLRILKRF